ncbi:MFS transporter [Streptomyces sp. NPDC047061]|uniref:MFS transporter n=1 Tax=Streptomyces sp. NPDC047061 TaxID=3154605 RepID=UPI0033F06C73
MASISPADAAPSIDAPGRSFPGSAPPGRARVAARSGKGRAGTASSLAAVRFRRVRKPRRKARKATPGPADGPVLVSIVYRVSPDDRAAFAGAMENVARSRRRTGALTWGLYEDGNEPGRFIENYLVGSWAEHLAQHHTRQTVTDQRFEELARSFLLPGTAPEATRAFDAAVAAVTAVAAVAAGRGRRPPAPPPPAPDASPASGAGQDG